MGIEIVNQKKYRGPGFYVGRPSLLGNPFTHLTGKTAAQFVVPTVEDAIKAYRLWLKFQVMQHTPVAEELGKLIAIYRQTGRLILICWCAPYRHCHAEVIKEFILGVVKPLLFYSVEKFVVKASERSERD